jgi:hypothetical protein
MKRLLIGFSGLLLIGSTSVRGQILLSGGLTYSQNFNSLASSSVGATVPWADNTTLLGWYASRAYTVSGGAYGPYPYVAYRVSGGENNSGWIYSFGTNGVNPITERAFGSISSGTPVTNAWGVRIQNDTANVLGGVRVTYTGEQWRNGGNTVTQTMYFTYRTSSGPITNPTPGDESLWTAFPALSSDTPTTGSVAMPIDGNAPGNYRWFSNVLLPGVTLNPGNEIFLRWYDINELGNDHGFGVDDLTVTFTVLPPLTITTQPTNQTVQQGQGATFSVAADGFQPLSYQWRFNASPLTGATINSYTVANAQPADEGSYSVVVTNSAGSITSSVAKLTVLPRPVIVTQPHSQTVLVGQTGTFSVSASGIPALSYQWLFGGQGIPGATGSTCEVHSAQFTNAGAYSVVVANPGGVVTSSVSCLVVISLYGDFNWDGVVDETELNMVLTNYWPTSPWLAMTNLAGLGGTNVTFALSNSTAGSFSVEWSTNLADWDYLGPATPLYQFIDSNAPALPQRFYRLRWP